MPDSFITLNLPFPAPDLSLAVHAAGDQVVSAAIARDRLWEPFETRLVWDCLEPGAVFADVGANLGYFTILAASRAGEGGHVFAFEPDPANCALLRKTLDRNGLNDCVTVEEAALGAENGNAHLYLSDTNFGDHQVFATHERRDSRPIRVLRGADYFQPRIPAIDLLKIDTQGSEFLVLSGLAAFLSEQQRPPRLLIELTPFSLREAGASGRALVELLATLQLPFWIIDHIDGRLVRSDEKALAQWCDNVDACEGDQGFMNIFVGAPPEGWGGTYVLHPLAL